MDKLSKETLALLAYLYIEHFKYDKALNLLKALHFMYPDDIDITRSLGFACLKTGDYQSALMHAEASMKPGIDEDKFTASNLIKGKALWGLGKEEAARHALIQLQQKQPKEKK